MVDFNSVQNSRDCRADKTSLIFLFRIFECFVLINKSFDWLITEYNIVRSKIVRFESSTKKNQNNIF